jgi:bifunctional UDP-N-acetylglucosamine pyrophosphorylase/glucosamine-1-phosphate N-acetyltransferase
MIQLKTVILAAGKGTRMKSDLPKVLHPILGKPIVEYVIEAARGAGSQDICLVVGYQGERVRKEIGEGVSYAWQEEQLGTGHAVKCARDFIGTEGDVLILCGDTPLISANTLKLFYQCHKKQENVGTMLSAMVQDADGYGRIIRDAKGHFIKNVEDKDATEAEKASKEINAGMYMFAAKELLEALEELTNDNAQGEYYLPDVLEIIRKKGGRVESFIMPYPEETLGVNSREQLAYAETVMKNRQ